MPQEKTDRADNAAPRASSAIDSGARWFCGDKMYFHQLDELTINVSTARNMEDADWLSFLEGTLAISRSLRVATKVSICSLYAYPDARQRMMASEFLVRHHLEKMGRVAVVTENILARGAMTAFSWIMPKVGLSAFSNEDAAAAFHWLHEAGTFDEAQAMLIWNDAQRTLGMTVGSIPPGSIG
ncbi:MAG TPA: STAS/SEC14 domain-containing protein [Polyangiaceae bacterium]|nr:STAS/SEC14 domain-containing protein [Polyangiaceae bacterium]